VARRVILTRPEAESRAIADDLARLGIEALIAPLLEIRPTGARLEDTARYQAFLVTSGNGIDGLATATPRRDVTVFAVGRATAERARTHGFAAVAAAEGTGADLAGLVAGRLLPEGGPILWASGDEVRVDMADSLGERGFTVDRITVYRAEAARRLPAAAAQALIDATAEGVLLFSPRTARCFVSLVTDAGLTRRTIPMVAYCLSAAVAEAAGGLPWAAVRIAAQPSREGLLATLGDPTSSVAG
jgi:uroporphyrinogen-III synthase